jgi:DNA-binding CsgD family transcriptional regulator
MPAYVLSMPGRHDDLLTPREREVAALVARGHTSRQIAVELVIASGTAAIHVEHIREKLGFHSRAQIAAWVVEQGLDGRHAPSELRRQAGP